MSSKLSAWKYVKNNKRTVAVLITALALSFMAMYAVYVLLITSTESFEVVITEMPKKVSFVALGNEAYGLKRENFESYEEFKEAYDASQAELIEKLKAHPGIENAFYTQIIKFTYQSVMGSCSFELPLMEPKMVRDFLDHVDAKLTGGEMPKRPGEVLVDETILKNGGYKIGDWYQEAWFGETFKVIGTIKSKSLVCVGVPNEASNNGWYIVVYNDETATDLTGILKDNGITPGDGDEIWDDIDYKPLMVNQPVNYVIYFEDPAITGLRGPFEEYIDYFDENDMLHEEYKISDITDLVLFWYYMTHYYDGDSFDSKIEYSYVDNLIILFHGDADRPVWYLENDYSISISDVDIVSGYQTAYVNTIDIQTCYAAKHWDGDDSFAEILASNPFTGEVYAASGAIAYNYISNNNFINSNNGWFYLIYWNDGGKNVIPLGSSLDLMYRYDG